MGRFGEGEIGESSVIRQTNNYCLLEESASPEAFAKPSCYWYVSHSRAETSILIVWVYLLSYIVILISRVDIQ